MSETTRQSRQRRSRGKTCERVTRQAPAFVTHEIPFYAMLDEESLLRSENQADRIIQEIGLKLREDEEALRLWREVCADA
jgi:trimethylamine---corrinoid protein Co-methyltransferase